MANAEQMLGSATFREMGSVLGVSGGILLQLWGKRAQILGLKSLVWGSGGSLEEV